MRASHLGGPWSRRFWIFTAILGSLHGCRNQADRMEILPMNLGEYHRMAVENIPAEEYPPELKERGIKRARRGIYQNKAKITASVYEFGAPAVAFEMVQKWKPELHKMSLHEGPYFAVLASDDADAKTLSEFATVLEASLKK